MKLLAHIPPQFRAPLSWALLAFYGVAALHVPIVHGGWLSAEVAACFPSEGCHEPGSDAALGKAHPQHCGLCVLLSSPLLPGAGPQVAAPGAAPYAPESVAAHLCAAETHAFYQLRAPPRV